MSRALLTALLLGGCGAPTSGSDNPGEPGARGEWRPGGDTTNTLLAGDQAFSLPADNITAEHEALFFTGNSFFNQGWVQAPASTELRDGLGPLFNARSCDACHFKDGRGRPPFNPEEPVLSLLLRISRPRAAGAGDDPPIADPTYGGQIQPFAVADVPAEATPHVHTTVVAGSYADGTPYSLAAPSYELAAPGYGPLPADLEVSPRVAPAMVGLGLLEAIPQGRLEALADPEDADGDGVSGRLNWVWSAAAGALAPGRFGWKAEKPSVTEQAAGAFAGDIGMTSTLATADDCTAAQPECRAALSGGAPELDDGLLARVATYSRLLAVPARTDDTPEVARGKALFAAARCAACHVPSHDTDVAAELPEVRGQRIWPYSDLLLHDLGAALSDGRPTFAADGREWRTPPLWGLRFYPVVNDHDRLLHDGRARGVAEAVLWHGGEAEAARTAFVEMSADERADLVAFVESL